MQRCNQSIVRRIDLLYLLVEALSLGGIFITLTTFGP